MTMWQTTGGCSMHGRQRPGKRAPRSCFDESLEQWPLTTDEVFFYYWWNVFTSFILIVELLIFLYFNPALVLQNKINHLIWFWFDELERSLRLVSTSATRTVLAVFPLILQTIVTSQIMSVEREEGIGSNRSFGADIAVQIWDGVGRLPWTTRRWPQNWTVV